MKRKNDFQFQETTPSLLLKISDCICPFPFTINSNLCKNLKFFNSKWIWFISFFWDNAQMPSSTVYDFPLPFVKNKCYHYIFEYNIQAEMSGHACPKFVRVRVRVRDFRTCPCLKSCTCPSLLRTRTRTRTHVRTRVHVRSSLLSGWIPRNFFFLQRFFCSSSRGSNSVSDAEFQD